MKRLCRRRTQRNENKLGSPFHETSHKLLISKTGHYSNTTFEDDFRTIDIKIGVLRLGQNKSMHVIKDLNSI